MDFGEQFEAEKEQLRIKLDGLAFDQLPKIWNVKTIGLYDMNQVQFSVFAMSYCDMTVDGQAIQSRQLLTARQKNRKAGLRRRTTFNMTLCKCFFYVYDSGCQILLFLCL